MIGILLMLVLSVNMPPLPIIPSACGPAELMYMPANVMIMGCNDARDTHGFIVVFR